MPKKCKYCQEPFTPRFSSLEKSCQKENCRVQYAMEVVAKQKETQKKLVAQKWKAEKAVLKDKLKGIPEYKKDLEKEINKICCLIDYKAGCISCKSQSTPQAGHYHTVQSNGSIRYNLDNLHTQDYNCNCAKGGNLHQYDLGLIDRYGADYWEYVKFDLVSKYPLLKMTIPDYKEKIIIARRIVKELQAENKIYSPIQQFLLRKRYNYEIGIYR